MPGRVSAIAEGAARKVEELPSYRNRAPDTTTIPAGMITDSAKRLFQTAARLKVRVLQGSDQLLHVRHLLGAYIYDPGGDHRDQLERWGLHGEPWSQAFLRYLAGSFAGTAELDAWKQVHVETFSTTPQEPETPEQTGSEQEVPEAVATAGLAGHLASDLWTRTDSLGYRAYSHALYRFLTDPRTQAPLTVAIQAAWGGGKTSLMRMVQEK